MTCATVARCSMTAPRPMLVAATVQAEAAVVLGLITIGLLASPLGSGRGGRTALGSRAAEASCFISSATVHRQYVTTRATRIAPYAIRPTSSDKNNQRACVRDHLIASTRPP